MEDFLLFLSVIYIGFSFIALIVLLGRTRDMKVQMDLLHKKLYDLAKAGSKTTPDTTVKSMESLKQEIQKTVPPPAPLTPPVAEPVLRSTPEITKPETPNPQFADEIMKPVTAASTIPQARAVPPPRPLPPSKPKKPGFWESNPDLEKFIGENLINKIGIAILVLGIGFFVKFAIDQDWINEYGRVAIGVLCGGILIGTAHYLRNTYRAFSSVLVGGGVATLYFTFTLAFQLYKIPSEAALAFLIMVLITIFTVILSIAYDRKELAVLGIIGGFGAPLMVSTGQGNYIVLFTYIAILNIGMLILAYFKRWNIINVIAFIFTVILYAGWMVSALTKEGTPFPYLGALIFATLFYLIFFLMNIINNLKENKQFVAFEFSLLLANTIAYYSAGMYILQNLHEGLYQGLFTTLLAAFNFAFAFTLFRTKKVDTNVIYLLIGLVMTFVSLAAPIQLQGNYITLFWAAEAVLLLWLSQKSGIKLMKLGSLIINLLMMISLVMDWNNVYLIVTEQQNILFNKAFLTTLAVIASLLSTLYLLKHEDEKMSIGIEKEFYASFLSVALGLIIYFGGIWELYYQLSSRLAESRGLENILAVDLLLYTIVYVVALQFVILKQNKTKLLLFPVGLSLVITLLYFVIGYWAITELRYLEVAHEDIAGIHYLMHYPLVIFFVVMLVQNLYLINKKEPEGKLLKQYLWIFCGSLLFALSTELEHFIVWTRSNNSDDIYAVRHQVFKVGFPILWGISGFIAMIIGMIKKIKALRIISLVIFGITLLKIAIFDIREMSAGGKIAAFILLGVLLLIISYLYQRTEKRLKEEEELKSKNNTVE